MDKATLNKNAAIANLDSCVAELKARMAHLEIVLNDLKDTAIKYGTRVNDYVKTLTELENIQRQIDIISNLRLTALDHDYAKDLSPKPSMNGIAIDTTF